MRQLFRRPGPEARLAAAAEQQPAESGPTRLLVVEDDPLFRELVLDLTATWEDFHVDSATCLADVEAGPLDAELVLLDLHLPDAQGLDTLRRVLRLLDDASIVVFTGSDETGLGLDAVRAGAQDFLPKTQLDEDLLQRTLRFAVERRRLEKIKRQVVQERAENERLRILSTERSRFYEGITQHIRGPMESLSIQMSLLAHDLADDRRHRRALAGLQEQVGAMSRLAASMNDIAAIQAGGLEVGRDAIDLADVVATRVEAWQERAREHRLAIQAMLEPGTIQGDGARLSELTDRILENAIAHTPAGGVITVTVAPEDGKLALAIQDSGQGMIPERLARATEAYLWPPEARTGLGMGLAICQGIVDAHGGRMELSCQEGLLVQVWLDAVDSQVSG